MSTYISCTETAKLIRTELKKNFSGIKFSVRSSSYAGGASISVEWIDGPSGAAVEKVVKIFEGSTFDSSIDLKSYVQTEWNGEEVHFGADSIHCNRKHSRIFLETVLRQFCQRHGLALPKIEGRDDNAWIDAYAFEYHERHWYRDLIEHTDAKDMHRVYEAEAEREVSEQAEWEAGAAERERQAEAERQEQERLEQIRREREQREQERRDRERQEQARRQQEQQERNALKILQQAALTSNHTARLHLGVKVNATRDDVLKAFRERVKSMADGKGGYSGDMDFLVQVKEKALGV